MFEDSLMESQNRLSSPTQRWTTAVSLTLQCALVAGLIVVPLLHPEVLPFRTDTPAITLPLRPVPPPVPHINTKTAAYSSSAPATAPASGTPAPNLDYLRKLELIASDGPPVSSFPGSMIGSGTMPAGIGISSTGASNRVTQAPSASAGPLHISRGVSNGMLLTPIKPVYPRMAVASRTEGVVVVEAIISKTGRIESARATSGPPLLREAALDAIRNARYTPYLLNDSPTEVETTITVNFKLAG